MTLEITSGQVYRGKLLEGQLIVSVPIPTLEPLPIVARQSRTEIWYKSADTTFVSYSRRQHERPIEGHHRHRSRRASEPSRSSLHPREPREIFYCAGYATVRGQQQTLTESQRARLTIYLTATRRCSGREGQEAAVWGWQEEGLL